MQEGESLPGELRWGRGMSQWDRVDCRSPRSPTPSLLTPALVSLPLGKGKASGERIRNAYETAMI